MSVSDSKSKPCLTGALTRGSVLGQSCVSSPSLEHGGFETRGAHCLGEEEGGRRKGEKGGGSGSGRGEKGWEGKGERG